MINKIIQEGIYIIHALKGYEFHEKRIKDLFAKNNLSFQFVTEGDPSYFRKDILEKYFTDDIHEVLTDGVLSCTLNHIIAYESIVQKNKVMQSLWKMTPIF